jgi:8-oxo-dGTP pyrophosphatase MutT (NUDIX family)
VSVAGPADPAAGDVPVRDAATVVLLRDGDDGIEAWLLTRVTQMTFAAGMTVFPGGRVDAADASLPLAGGDVAGLAARFDCDVRTVHALLGAAVRETFEETGVLLSTPPADLSDARADVERGLVSFGDLLRANALSVDADALHPWSRWVTPAGEVRRYDTRFFVGALPHDAVAANVTSESSEASWVPVGEAIEQAKRGERQMLPPTMTTLVDVARFDTVADVLASSRSRALGAVRPGLLVGDDGSVSVELPDGTVVPIPRSMLP